MTPAGNGESNKQVHTPDRRPDGWVPSSPGYDVTAEFKGGASVPIGRPIANTSCYVLDTNLQLQPIGLPGELMVSGVQVCRGYLKRPDLTAEKFIPNPYAAGRPLHDRLYCTGVQPAALNFLATMGIGLCEAPSICLTVNFYLSPCLGALIVHCP